jgi:hypothetical protein
MTAQLKQQHHVYIIPPTRPLLAAPQSSGITYAIGLVLAALVIAFMYVIFDLIGSVGRYRRST